MDWPQLDELKQVLDVRSDDWDGEASDYADESRLTALLGAAIDQVKFDVGGWVDGYDEPDYSLNRAALRLAELMALKPELAATVAAAAAGDRVVTDPVYARLMVGHHRTFGVSTGPTWPPG